jgi:hypothetical protein
VVDEDDALTWLLVASAAGSFEKRLATRLERCGAIVEKHVVLSDVVQRVRAAVTLVVGRIAAVVRATTRPAVRRRNSMRDLGGCRGAAQLDP